MTTPTHRASCHCGGLVIRFTPMGAPSKTGCDCSICRRKPAGGVTVMRGDLVVERGETLRVYTFGTHVAQHYFCGTCGIHTHHRRRSDPNEYRVVEAGILGPVSAVAPIFEPSSRTGARTLETCA